MDITPQGFNDETTQRGQQHSQEPSTLAERIGVLKADISPLDKLRQLTEFYPEMKQLVQPLAASPEGNVTIANQTFGEQIFDLSNETVIEYNRTAICLCSLEQVIMGKYDDFTACQTDPSSRLTRESFKALQEYTEEILQCPEALDAMITWLAINDLGKVKSIKDFIDSREGKQSDHDAVLSKVLEKYPHLSPSFERLSRHYQDIIFKSLRANFSLGQFIQGENVPASLEKVRYLDSEAREFDMLYSLYDIAGALGQFVQNGSAVMIEQNFQVFKAAVDTLQETTMEEASDQIYAKFLRKRVEMLGLPFKNDQDYAIAQLVCMMPVNPLEAMIVADAFTKLPQEIKTILQTELVKKGTNDGKAIILYYAPAFLRNIRRTVEKRFKDQRETDPFRKVVEFSLHRLAEIYKEVRDNIPDSSENGIYVFDLADRAKENY